MQGFLDGPRAGMLLTQVEKSLAWEHSPQIRWGVDILDADTLEDLGIDLDFESGGVRWQWRAQPDAGEAPVRAVVRRQGSLRFRDKPGFNPLTVLYRPWVEMSVPVEPKEPGDMTLVVPNIGEEGFLDLILSVDYDLKLFQNDVTSGLTATQVEALTEADFTEATFTGYVDVTLTGGAWTTTPDDPSTAEYAQQAFTSSADQAVQTIYGYYAVNASTGALRWFEYFASPVEIEFDNEQIRVTPRLTLADTQD